MTLHELIGAILEGSFEDLRHMGTPRLSELMDLGAILFSHYEVVDQLMVLPMMLGMLLAAQEQSHGISLFEQENRVILTHDDHLALLLAITHVTYSASLAAHAEKVKQMPPAEKGRTH